TEPARRTTAMAERRRDMERSLAQHGLTRRALLWSAALGGTGLAGARLARAAARPASSKEAAYVPRPNATQYVIGIGPGSINPDGAQMVPAVLANGRVPGPEIRVREGDILRVLVENQLPDSPTSIHWHGLLLPAAMDGVPDISNAPIAAAQTYVYEYPIRQSGTYWYHSHFGFQEQQGCYGAFVIEPKHEPLRTEHDAVILLADWLHRNPQEVFDQLRGSSAPSGGTAAATPAGVMAMGGTPGTIAMDSTPETMRMGGKPGGMQMGTPAPEETGAAGAKPAMPMKMGAGNVDLSDVKYDAFLLNGRGPDAPWTLAVRRGERVRLRLINGGSSTYFRIRLDGHRLQVTHADGLAVEPVIIDHLLIGMGEIYDAVVQIADRGSFTLHAVAQDGSGQALGVIHTADASPQPNRAMPSFDGRGLSYTDLVAAAPTTLPDGPVRSFRLPLQGDMARYVWMIDGQAWPKADPLRIR